MPTKLRKLKITRVAVCEQGANPDADILLFKQADATATTLLPHAEPDGAAAPPMDYATRGQQQDLWRCLWDKWDRFVAVYEEVTADCNGDNVPHLPILVASIGQFQQDVAQLLEDCGVLAKCAPALATLAAVGKAGAKVAGHRLRRLREAIGVLEQILDECTPAPIDRPGVSAAAVRGVPLVLKRTKGGAAMAVRKTTESDKEHCDSCDDPDCDNPAHDRMQKEERRLADTLAGVTKRAELAEARALALEARVAELEPLVAKAADLETTLAKMRQTPEEQEAAYLAGLPESVRKRYEADQLEKVELRTRLAEADERVAKADFIAKTAEFRPFGMVPEKHWTIVKAIQDLPEADREELTRLIKANMAQVDTAALFSVRGADTPDPTGSTGAVSANDQILALATAYAKEHSLTLATSIEAIAKERPDLWRRDQLEKRHANRVTLGSR